MHLFVLDGQAFGDTTYGLAGFLKIKASCSLFK